MQTQEVDLSQIDPDMLVEALKKYLESHPEIIYKVFSSTTVLQSLATKEDLKLIVELMEKGFEMMDKRFESLQREMDKRFEAMEKRFEAMDRRFEVIEKRFEAMDKRFEAMEKRFEMMDRRFESLQREMDKRFEAIDKRLNFFQWFMGLGFSFLAFLITLINFVLR